MSKDNYTKTLIEQFKLKYGLVKDDFWNLARGGKDTWIIKHNALEKAAAHENMSWTIEVLNFSPDIVVKCTAKHGDRQVESLGEASPKNTKQAYPYAMAEKRAVDRCILKLLNAHAYLYSDVEADEFQQGEVSEPVRRPVRNPTPPPPPAQNATSPSEPRTEVETAVDDSWKGIPEHVRPHLDNRGGDPAVVKVLRDDEKQWLDERRMPSQWAAAKWLVQNSYGMRELRSHWKISRAAADLLEDSQIPF